MTFFGKANTMIGSRQKHRTTPTPLVPDRPRDIAKAESVPWMAWVGAGLLAVACVDTSPIAVSKDAGVPTPVRDAPLGEVSDPHPACHACIEAPNDPGPGCANQLARCNANAGCQTIYECAYKIGCVFKVDYQESLACALPCTEGILNAFQEPIMAAIALTECFHAACTDVCGVEAPPP
jgi:hypothetical protein